MEKKVEGLCWEWERAKKQLRSPSGELEKQQKEFQRSTLKLKVYSILISTLAGELLEICAYHFLMWKLGALWPIYLQFPLNQLFGRHWFDIVSEIYWWDLCCGAILWFQCALCSLAVLISMIPPKSYEEVMTVFHEFPSVDPVVLYDSCQHPDSPCVNRDSVSRIRGRHERRARLVTLQHDDLHVQKSLVENSWLGVCQKLHPRKDVHAVPRLCSPSLMETACWDLGWHTHLCDVCGFRLFALAGKFNKNRNSEKHNFGKQYIILNALPGHSV